MRSISRGDVLPHLIAERARTDADRPAMKDVTGRSVTWSQVHDSSLRWAALLRDHGVGEGATVVTMMPNSFEGFHVWLGAAWLRAIEVPVNTMYQGEMLRYVLQSSEARLAVIESRYLDQVVGVLPETAVEALVVPDADESTDLASIPVPVVRGVPAISAADPANDLEGPDPWDVGAMIFTSGTTGPSKGVLVPWGELYQWPQFLPEGFLGPDEPYYSVFPLFHLSGKCTLYSAAQERAYLLLRETFSLSEFWSDVRTHGVRTAGLVGPMAAMLLWNPPEADDIDNPLEQLVMGPIIPNIEEFKHRYGIKRVATGYGTTEVGFPIASPWNPPPGTCGKVREGAPHYEIRLVDEHDEPVPIGEIGELVVRTRDPWVMNLGYWQRPEATAAAWRNGWFHTGDAFTQDADGWLYLVDRISDTLRRRGENISSFEVEQAVLAHPEVAECAVVAVPADVGEDDVKAVIVRTPGADLAPAQLIEFLAPRMPGFMVPRYVEFVEQLPKTDGTFRVKKVELRAAGIERAWDREAHKGD